MKKLIFLLLFIIPALTTYSQSEYRQPTDATDCSNIFFKALLEEDTNTLGNLLLNDFSAAGFQGQPINREFLLNLIIQGYLRIDSGMLSGTRTRNYGDVGIITGNWNASGLMQNNSFQNDLTYMVVCVKSGGSWKVSAVQFTPIR